MTRKTLSDLSDEKAKAMRKPQPAPQVKALRQTSDTLAALDRYLGVRISLRQAMALVSIMRAQFEGREQSLIQLKIDVGGIPFRSIERLRDLGLIELENCPGDRRLTLTSLTDEGWVLARELVEI